jgi:hypothetical protein
MYCKRKTVQFFFTMNMSILIDLLCFNATVSNISAISWRPVLVVEEATDHGQATNKLYHLRLQVECTLFVIYKAGREHITLR